MSWGRGCAFVFTGKKKLWILSKLIKIIFNEGRPPRDLGYRHEERVKKDYRIGNIYADPSIWEHSKTG